MSSRTSAVGAWPADAGCAAAGRRLVRQLLRGTPGEPLQDAAEVVVTELLTNVVLHAGGTARLRLHLQGEDLVVEVGDDSAVAPRLRGFSASAGTGRGIRLVTTLSADHGVRLEGGGKTVWARLTAGSALRGDDALAEEFADTEWGALVDELADSAGASAEASARALRTAA